MKEKRYGIETLSIDRVLNKGLIQYNLTVYGVNNCQNKNMITHFVWYCLKEKRYGIESLSIDRVLNKEHFY